MAALNSLWKALQLPLPGWLITSIDAIMGLGAAGFLVFVTVVDPFMGACLWIGVVICGFIVAFLDRGPEGPQPPGSAPENPPLEPSGVPVLPLFPDYVLIGRAEEQIPRRVAEL